MMKIGKKTQDVLRICLTAGAVLFALFLLIHYWDSIGGLFGLLSEGLTPLLIGAVTAYLVNILMSFFERKLPNVGPLRMSGVRRGVSLTLALLCIIGIIVLVLVLVIPQFFNCIRTLVLKAPAAIEQMLSNPIIASFMPEDWESQLTSINWTTLIDTALSILRSGLLGGANVISTGFSVVVDVVLGLVFALYILIDKNNLSRQLQKLGRAYLKPDPVYKIEKIVTVLNKSFHKYVVGQCVEAFILGSLCALGMMILRLPYFGMIGALVGVTALIPVAGCWIGAIVGAFMILSISPTKALIFLIFLLILQQVENNLIYPKVVGTSVGLSGMWVLAAVTIGGTMMGVGGMMVSVPLTATIFQLLREDVNRRLPAPLVVAAQKDADETTGQDKKQIKK